MTRIKTNLSMVALAISSVFVSCSSDNDVACNASSEYINTVRVTVEDFIPETAESRTAYTVDNTGFHFSWAEGDALGIYPVGGDQVKFPISAGGGSKSATFDGGSWKLRSNFQYAAYYPFSTANYTIAQTALPVSYTGQTQNGNGSTAHVGAYDYLACAATQPDGSGGVDLQMKQLGAFLRLQLTMPKADTYSSVVLESDGAKFVTTGTFDLTAATPAITATATSSTYTINLTNVSTTAANEMVTVYALVAPANLSAANIKVTVHGAGQTTYAQTVLGKNFQAGKAYNIAVTTFPSGTNASGEDVSWEEAHTYVDLGLSVKWATTNVGATSPEDFGDYFAWGETDPYYTEGHAQDNPCTNWKEGKMGYNWVNYKWCNGTSTSLTKYCASSAYGTVDGKSVLDATDDAATVNWGSEWRMPTYSELRELYEKCYLEYTANYNNTNITGFIIYKVKSTSDKGKIKYSGSSVSTVASYSLSDNHIFLPASGGGRYNDYIYNINDCGCYWTKSHRYNNIAYALWFQPNLFGWSNGEHYGGSSVRPVYNN